MIEDKNVKLNDQTRWDLYAQRIGEPKRFEDWKSRVCVYLFLAALAVGGAVGLWMFLTKRVG